MKCLEQANLGEEIDWWLPGTEGAGKGCEVTADGNRVSFWGSENCPELNGGDSYEYTKCH